MLTATTQRRYASPAGAKSSAGRENPNSQRRTSAPMTGAFFVPVSYGGCAWETFGSAGFLECRSANPRTVAPIRCFAAAGDDSTTLGVIPMASFRLFPTRDNASRAAAHRAMAKAALFADSSTKTRLKRYNAHMAKARHLEARINEQEATS